MIRDRLITILELEKITSRELEKKTNIDRYKWGNVKGRKQRLHSEYIEAITEIFPEYAFWLTTGKEMPEAGQISPMTKKAQQDLGQQGKAG